MKISETLPTLSLVKEEGRYMSAERKKIEQIEYI